MGALAEMYIQGVSTRKVKAITEELCGHSVSASTISRINKRLDKTLTAFAERELDEPMPYLILDARYEKVRDSAAGATTFLRNVLDHIPRNGATCGRVDDDCLRELRWLYGRRDVDEARADLAAWLGRWQAKYPALTDWVEDNIETTWTFYRLPRQHHKSTNMLERLNEEIRRRTRVVRSSRTATAASAWSAPSPSRRTRTGSRPTAI